MNTRTVTGIELAKGDIIRDDVYCRIVGATDPNYDERMIIVEDGTGLHYNLRIGIDETFTVYDWTEEEWDEYVEED